VETSDASSVEYWANGESVWLVGGASGIEYETVGASPIDLNAEAEAYRVWWNGHPRSKGLDLPESNEDLIVKVFSSLTRNYFADLTAFPYDGDHPALYRLSGTLPTVDMRKKRSE
jgi:hypothetical protein